LIISWCAFTEKDYLLHGRPKRQIIHQKKNKVTSAPTKEEREREKSLQMQRKLLDHMLYNRKLLQSEKFDFDFDFFLGKRPSQFDAYLETFSCQK